MIPKSWIDAMPTVCRTSRLHIAAIALTRESRNVHGTARQSQDLIERHVPPPPGCRKEP